jgi:hypothetical protein
MLGHHSLEMVERYLYLNDETLRLPVMALDDRARWTKSTHFSFLRPESDSVA